MLVLLTLSRAACLSSGAQGLYQRRNITNIREIKAYVHKTRIADVVNALDNVDFKKLTVTDVGGLLKALDNKEQGFSAELNQRVVTEVKLELVCESENRTAEAVAVIREHAKSGQPSAGWIYITEIKWAIEIAG